MAAATKGSVEWLDRDLEARKHLYAGLARLGPQGRIRFVSWAANVASRLGGQAHDEYERAVRLARAAGMDFGKAWQPEVASLLGINSWVTDHTGTVSEAYLDLAMLAVTHGLDLSRACEELERWLKREV